MSKIVTSAMERQKKRKPSDEKRYSFWGDAWKRFRRNKLSMLGLGIIVLLLLVSIFAGYLCPYDYAEANVLDKLQGPSAKHWFGTDNLGRDLFSRCLYATRISLPMGLAGSIGSLVLGGVMGLVAAFFMGKTDNVIMRVMDILQAIPSMLMAVCVVATVGTGVWQLILAMSISNVPFFAKTVRSAALTVRSSEYVEASRTVGAQNLRLMFKHVLPNCVGHVIIFAVSSVSGCIMLISMLSYIGLGVQPPLPEWGSLLAAGKSYIMSHPTLVIFPGLCILITVFAFNLFGDGVRDALDPRLN